MGVTIQVRNLDADVQESLKKLARSEGLSLSEYLRRALTRIAERQRAQERWDEAVARHEAWVEELRRTPRPRRGSHRIEGIAVDDIVQAVHEGREERTDQLLSALGLDAPERDATEGEESGGDRRRQ